MSAVADAVVECDCGSSTFHAVYKVPVYAVVEAGTLTRVVVADESIEGPLVVECAVCSENESRQTEVAQEVAEKATWPGWEFGW